MFSKRSLFECISPLLTTDTGTSLPDSSVFLSLCWIISTRHPVVSFTSKPQTVTQPNKILSLDSTSLCSDHFLSLLPYSRSSLSGASSSFAPLLLAQSSLASSRPPLPSLSARPVGFISGTCTETTICHVYFISATTAGLQALISLQGTTVLLTGLSLFLLLPRQKVFAT